MRPTAPTFEPSRQGPVMGTAKALGADQDSLNDSLLKALVEEKEDHRTARINLEAAQAQVNSLSAENRTLKASKRMLEAIVKSKAQQSDQLILEPQVHSPTAEEQTQAVKAFFAKASKINSAHKSILYDVLAEQRETYEIRGYPQGPSEIDSTAVSTVAEHNLEVAGHNLQQERLFDLSLVSRPAQETSEFSAVEQKLFRHFLDELESDSETHPSSLEPRDPKQLEHSFLVEVTPPPQRQSNEKTTYRTESETRPAEKQMVAEAVKSCQQALKRVLNGCTNTEMGQAKHKIEVTPTLQLPASFVLKYRRASKQQPEVKTAPEPGHIPAVLSAADDAQTTSASITPSVNEHQPISNMPPLPLPRQSHHRRLPILIQEHPKVNTGSQVAALPVLDTKIKWAMGALVPVFDNEEERRWAQQNSTNKGSYFWQHTVRFLPNPTEKNLYRTVMIDYIPPGATYQDVLAHVRTGALESIQLFSPLRGSTDYFTARAIFIYELPAVSMVMHYQKRMDQGRPIKIKGSAVRFWQVLQPTYPANKRLEADIFEHGYTRILLLEHVENTGVLPKLHEKLDQELHEGFVIKINRTEDGVPMVEFTTVAAAAGAMRRFQGDRDFNGCTFDFDKDYCEDPYDEE